MARLPRLYAPAIVQHVVQRPVDGRLLFVDADDYRLFTALLADAVQANGLALHAYVLMPSQVRLLGTPNAPDSIARTMQAIGRRYVAYLNRKTGRSGPLSNRRFRATLIDAPAFLIASMRFIEQQPWAARLTDGPVGWRWSSADHHTGGGQQSFVTDHAAYWALSDTPFARQAVYRGLLEEPLDAALAARMEDAVARGWALGDDAFIATLQSSATRRATPLKRGRPRIVMSLIDAKPKGATNN